MGWVTRTLTMGSANRVDIKYQTIFTSKVLGKEMNPLFSLPPNRDKIANRIISCYQYYVNPIQSIAKKGDGCCQVPLACEYGIRVI